MRVAILLLLAPLTLAAQETSDSVTKAFAEIRTERLTKFFAQGYKFVGKGSLGIWGHAQAQEKYLAFASGPSLRFSKFYVVGLGAGLESETPDTASHLFARGALIFVFDNSRIRFSFYNEVGESRDWYRVELLGLYNTAGVGVIAQSPYGAGLHARSMWKITERGSLGASGSYFPGHTHTVFLGLHYIWADRQATDP